MLERKKKTTLNMWPRWGRPDKEGSGTVQPYRSNVDLIRLIKLGKLRSF